jgi:FHS family glucose/mannose:H+ symporter-like MFS transporter
LKLRTSEQMPMYLGFAMTGIALTLPGALLPVLLRRWGMGDARGGLLLFCFFVASSAGALLARGAMARRVAMGSGVTALGALGLAWAGRATGLVAMSVYGCGLGLTMTAISLLQSRRFPVDRRVVMTRLNLVWAVGAVAGPWLALHGWRPSGHSIEVPSQALWWAMAGFFVAFALWVRWKEPEAAGEDAGSQTSAARGDTAAASGNTAAASANTAAAMVRRPMSWAALGVPWTLLVLIFCASGVESAVGGWLTTLAQRNADTLRTTIGAATLLWAGLLVGRIVHSTRAAARLPEFAVLGASTAMMALALALLIAWPASAVTMTAAAVLGFAAAPVYPLLLAMVLRERETAAIFVVAGGGSSLLPLATGVVSSSAHSLRAGLCVPLAAALGMAALVGFDVLKGRREA